MGTPVLNLEILKKLKKNTTAQLLIKVTKAKGEDLDVILDILQKRNQDVSKWLKKEPVQPVIKEEEELSPEEQAKIDQAEKEYSKKEVEKPKKQDTPKANKTQKKDLSLVDPRLLKTEDGFNTRFDYGDIEELKASIIENGVRVPLRGYKSGDNYVLVDGHRRLNVIIAAINEGNDIARVPFISEKKRTPEERILDIILSNDGKPLTPLELGETYRRLGQFGFNFTEISKKIGKTVKHVSDMVTVAESSTELKDLIKQGAMSATLVAEVKLKVKDTDEAEDLLKSVSSMKKEDAKGDKKKEKITKKDIEDFLPKKEEPIQPKKEMISFSPDEVLQLLKEQIKVCAESVVDNKEIKDLVLESKLVFEL